MKIFIDRSIPQAGLDLLKEHHIDVVSWEEPKEIDREKLIDACQACDGFLSAGHIKIDQDFISRCAHLKVISLMSVGFDRVDVDYATKRKIPIGHTPNVLSHATAETAFLLMMMVARKAIFLHNKIKDKTWGFFDPTANLGIQLHGKTLGIFGLGRIGTVMAEMAKKAYQMNIIYHNRHVHPEAEKLLNAKLVSFDELLSQSDVISTHAALTPQTTGIFNMDAFKKMKSEAIFVNTARGAQHNEEDLKKAIEEGIIYGAGLDVTNPEPMDANNPLLTMPTVAVLPHIGSQTQETRNEMAKMAAKNIIDGLQGKSLEACVNPDVFTLN